MIVIHCLRRKVNKFILDTDCGKAENSPDLAAFGWNMYKPFLIHSLCPQLDNAKVSSEMNDKAISTAREELQESHIRIESLGYQLNSLQKQVLLYDHLHTDLELLTATYITRLHELFFFDKAFDGYAACLHVFTFVGGCLRRSYQRAGGNSVN